MSATIKLTESGDTELWVVSGEGWTLPVYAHPYSGGGKEYYQVTQATAFTATQFDYVDRLFTGESTTPYEQFWLVPLDVLPRLATKAPGVTPSRYVKWAGMAASTPESFVVSRKASKEMGFNGAFLKYVNAKHNLTPTVSDLRYIWFIVCTEMAQWMHHSQKSVDFGFATLSAVPYRTNWKQILLSKFPNFMGLIRKFTKQPAFLANLALTEFPSEMRRSDLIGMTKNGSDGIMWSLEVTHGPNWTEFVKESEQRLMTEKGKTAYVSYWKSRVDKAENQIVQIFRSFV